MRISVVINTYNRADSLRNTLKALRRQTHREFEVIVVNGPSPDHTSEVLDEFAPDIRVYECPDRNLSKSRNVGIIAAAGEVVAFIDDDGIPDPRWLEELDAAYDSPHIGGAGGDVYDHTGYSLQYSWCVCDRKGNARFDIEPPLTAYQFPGSDPFVHLLGTNSSFRRSCLAVIGGFDEEFEYYLDETDVCMRVIDAGYWIQFEPRARVLHKFLASHLRNDRKALRHPFPVIKNKLYFALRSASSHESRRDVLKDCLAFSEKLIADSKWCVENDRLTAEEFEAFCLSLDHGFEEGIRRAFTTERKGVQIPPANVEDFLPYPTIRPTGERLNICLVSQDIPPEKNGGVARYTFDLAQGFAALGHEVHLVSRSSDHNRVDFEDGIWVHRVVDEADGPWNSPELSGTVRKNLGRAAAVHREVVRIHRGSVLNVISCPVWDCEGYFCLKDHSLPTVLTLETTFKIMSELDPNWKQFPDLSQLLALEADTVRSARCVHSISESILKNTRNHYGSPTLPAVAKVIPLGSADRAEQYSRTRLEDGRTRILYVGRLEPRKGTDLLLAAAERLIGEFPDIEFYLVGEDKIPAVNGRTYRELFEQKHPSGSMIRERVVFTGAVSEAALFTHYADSDVFCIPARYESFGLVAVEAMMFGKPVVAASVGGLAEIIQEGKTGYLAFPESVDSLVLALRRLLRDTELQQSMGAAGRKLYESRFTSDVMIRATLEGYSEMLESGRKAA